MTATVTLGGFSFQDFEVPERIPAGGEQMLAVHKLVGGQRVIDAMGRDDAALEWSGYFVGSDALDRALQVDAIRAAGAAVDLKWGAFSFNVAVRRFTYTYEADYRIPYQIACEVVKDNANPGGSDDDGPSLDDQMASDAATATSLASQVSGLISDLQGAISSVIGGVVGLSTLAGALDGAGPGLIQNTGTLSGIVSTLTGAVGPVVAPLPSLTSLAGALASAVGVVGQGTARASFASSSTSGVAGVFASAGVTSTPTFIV